MHHLRKASTLLFICAIAAISSCKGTNDPPVHRIVAIDGAVDFDCRVSDPHAKVELYQKKNNKQIPADGVKVIQVGQMFTMYNITHEDSGPYVCKETLTDATKRIFQVGEITAFQSNVKPKVIVSPKRNTAIEGESASFTCRASSLKFASVGWYKDAIELNNQNKSRNGNDYTSAVKISDLEPTSNGIYECRVQVMIVDFYELKYMGFFPFQAELIVQRFKFTSRQRIVFVGYVGSSFTINCNTTDPSATTSLWIQRSHQNTQEVTPDGVKIVQTGPRYAIHKVTIQDGGRYICKAVSTYGRTINMDMGRFIPLQGGYRDPKAYISPLSKNLVLDNDFNFTCQAFGDSINFTWYQDDSVVPAHMVTVFPRRIYQGYTMFESILMIRNAEKSDEGQITCQITSALQPGYSHSVTANLTIYKCLKANGKFRDPFNNSLYIECVNGTGTRQECPFKGQYWEDSAKDCLFPTTTPNPVLLYWISDEPVIQFMPPSSSFRFDCRLTDYSVPVYLKKDGNPVKITGTKVNQNGQIFTISNLQTGDNGQYSCHANGVSNSKRIRITINPDLTLELSVHVIGGTNRIELETTFHRTLICESYYFGIINWYKVDPNKNALTLVTKTPLPKPKKRNGYIVTTAYLELSDVTQKDAGLYMCRKNNTYSVANRTVEVIVKDPIKPTISTSLQNTIKENKLLLLKVAVSGSPFPNVTWYKEEQVLVTCRGGPSFTCISHESKYKINDSINVLHRAPKSTLLFKIINPLHPGDNGVHLIKVENIAGKDQVELNISVIVSPKIKNPNKETQVIPNSSPHLLVCQVTRAAPTPRITWQYQVLSCSGTPKCIASPSMWQAISSSVAEVARMTSMSSVLNVFPTDKLIYYRCNARNEAGSDKKDFALFRTGNFNEALLIEGKKIKYRNEGENVSLICRALKSFIGPPTWYSNDNRLMNSSRLRITEKENSTDYITRLQIFGSQVNDSGLYTCEATEKNGTKEHKTTILKVFELSQPFVSIRNLTVNQTNHGILRCTAGGHPPPTVMWIKEGQPLKSQFLSSLSECSSRLNGFYHLTPKPLDSGKLQLHSLVICNAKYDDSGWYKCKARNIIDKDERRSYLNVQAPPIVSFTNKELPNTAKVGDSVVIHCQAIGNPTPHVRWLKKSDHGSFAFLRNISTRTSGRSTLNITHLSMEDYGKYRCLATNILGKNHKDYDISKEPIFGFRFTNPKDGTVSKPALIGIVVAGSLVILLLLVIIAVLYQRKKLYGGFYILTLPPIPDYIKKLDPNRSLQEQSHKLPLCAEWEFSRNRLTLGKVIGSGAFGQVFVADAVGIVAFDPRSSMKGRGSRRRSRFGSTKSPYYNNKQVTTVACKGLKEDATESEYKDLVSELKILMHIGEHKNIVNLLGACTKGRECDLLVIIEYCPHGNLLEFLRKKRDLFEGKWEPATEKADERFTTTDLVITAFQVARAMEFLASRRCVHRDLAARNVLVGENYVMKVADFGLARDLYKNEHYVKTTAGLLPVKWMAIEALVDRIYTHQSDVWSFGVLLWEIFTLGGSPYPGLPANEVYQYLMEGHRMEKPHDCPHEIYALMLECWEHAPNRRPVFSAILQAIDKLLEEKTTQAGEEYLELENEQDLNENQPYYLQPEDVHPLSPVFNDPCGSPLPPIPSEGIELQPLMRNEKGQDYLNQKQFLFNGLNGLPKSSTDNKDSGRGMDKAGADSVEENQKKSESSGNISDEDEFISEKEHLMKNFDDERDMCEMNSDVFDTPPHYINTRPYNNVNNFIKNYGKDGATSKKEEEFRPRQQSARYV